MGTLTITELCALSPFDLNEEKKENAYKAISVIELTDIVEADVKHLFHLSQELLKHKGNQVELLLSELDELALKQGEDEAHHIQVMNELKDLQVEYENYKVSATEDTSQNDAQQQIIRLESENNELKSDTRHKEEKLKEAEEKIVKLQQSILALEEDNKVLKMETTPAKEEDILSNSGSGSLELPDDLSLEKYGKLTDLLRNKNQHILTLLNDIEEYESRENELKTKLSLASEELKHGTAQMEQLSQENICLRSANKEWKDEIVACKKEIQGLRNSIEELNLEKEIRNKELETLSAELDLRIKQWKDALRKKDLEINFIKSRCGISQSANELDHLIDFKQLTDVLSKREEQIEELKEQLRQATIDLNENSAIIEDYKTFDKKYEFETKKKLQKKLKHADEKISKLEEDLARCEDEALRKSEEVVELMLQLREYECGSFDLEAAVSQIKELKKQKKIRDEHIEQLVSTSNQLHNEANQLEQENIILRERLGIPFDAEVEGASSNYNEKLSRLQQLSKELNKRNEELIAVKMQNKQLRALISSPPIEVKDSDESSDEQCHMDGGSSESRKKRAKKLSSSATDCPDYKCDYELEERFKEMVDENEGLRKGMHEILESIRNLDVEESGVLQIESNSLENLLEAMDVRHASGWYQPAMRLQARIFLLNGVNGTLREELRNSRKRENNLRTELELLKYSLSADIPKQEILPKLETYSASDNDESAAPPPAVKKSRMEDRGTKIDKTHFSDSKQTQACDDTRDILSKELNVAIQAKDAIEEELNVLRGELSRCKIDNEELKNKCADDIEEWSKEKSELESLIASLRDSEYDLSAKNTLYEESLNAFTKSSSEVERTLAEITPRYAALKTNFSQMERKCQLLPEFQADIRKRYDRVNEELISLKQSTGVIILNLNREKDKLKMELDDARNLLDNSVEKAMYDNVANELNQLTLKYREFLHEQFLMKGDKERLTVILEKELVAVYQQINTMKNQMKTNIEELNKYKAVTDGALIPEQISTITKKLSGAEVEITQCKQHCEHIDRMYDIAKEEVKQSDARSVLLEQQVEDLIAANMESQKTEMELRLEISRLVDHSTYQVLEKELTRTKKELAQAIAEKHELRELVTISEQQLKQLDVQKKLYDQEYDSLQRRILELKSTSDDKILIDQLTKELVGLRQSNTTNNDDTEILQMEIMSLKNAIAKVENDLNTTKRDAAMRKEIDRAKIRAYEYFVRVLQKRYLGAIPLVKEEQWCGNLQVRNRELRLILERLTTVSSDSSEKQNHGSKSEKKDKSDCELNLQILEKKLKINDRTMDTLQRENTLLDELYNKLAGKLNQDEPVPRLVSTRDEMIQVESDADDSGLKRKIGELERTIAKMTADMNDLKTNMRKKEKIIADKEKEIKYLKSSRDEYSKANGQEPTDVMEVLSLKATVESLQNILLQKEDAVKRYQKLLKDSREENGQKIASLQQRINDLQTKSELKDFHVNRLKSKLDNLEETSTKDSDPKLRDYLTRIHELEDDLNQAYDKINSLSAEIPQQRFLNLTSIVNAPNDRYRENDVGNNLEYSAELKKLSDENQHLQETIDELKKKNVSDIKVGVYKDRLRNELERCKRRIQLLEDKENEYKAEIQKLKNQIISRPVSAARSASSTTQREEQLVRKVKQLEAEIKVHEDKEEKWREDKNKKCEEEMDKWQNRKRRQLNVDKLRQRLQESLQKIELLTSGNERLRETIIRMEKEKFTLENKIKSLKGQIIDQNVIAELQAEKKELKDEIQALKRSIQISAGDVSHVVEAQERKIAALEVSQRGDVALAREIERLKECKSQLQTENIRLEKENMRLKSETDKLKNSSFNQERKGEDNDANLSDSEILKQIRNLRRRNSDLERSVVVLKRVLEKAQSENKALHGGKIAQLQSESNAQKLQQEIEKLRENYLNALENVATLENELNSAKKKTESLQMLIERYQSGSEIASLQNQLHEKNELLSKVKIMLEKMAARERELSEKVSKLENHSESGN